MNVLRKTAKGFLYGTLAVFLFAMAANAAFADQKKLPVTQESAQLKLSYVTRLITNSAKVQLIEKSGDAKAIAALEEVRSLIEQATNDMASGDFAASNAKTSQAMRLLSAATRKLSAASAKINAIESYKSRRESVKSVLTAFDHAAQQKTVPAETLKKREDAIRYLKEADGLLEDGRIKEATSKLETAYELATSITRQARQGDVVVRELSFDTPEDEYKYEIDRNDSHFQLLDITLKKKKSNRRFAKMIEKYKLDAAKLRQQAEAEASKGDFTAGTKTLEKSTKMLIRAIRMGGNIIPG